MTNRQARYIGQSIHSLEGVAYLAIAAFAPAKSVSEFIGGLLFGLFLISSLMGYGSWKEIPEE